MPSVVVAIRQCSSFSGKLKKLLLIKEQRQFNMSSMSMRAPSAVIGGQRLRLGKSVAAKTCFVARRRNLVTKISAVVQYNYDTKVFEKELVKFADTEEYIYR